MTAAATSALAFVQPMTLEDPLDYLSCSTIVEYRKKRVIYNVEQPSTGIYLILDGRVKVSRLADDGHEAVVDIYRADELFGESALLGAPRHAEQATALETTKVMTWTAAEIEDMVVKRPKLAVALLQILARRTLDFGRRIESFSVDNGAHRLARSLLHFSERFGTPDNDGAVQMAAFTHELLSQYVGISREIITHHMNFFRKRGYLTYTRREIVVQKNAMKDWLHQDAYLSR